MQKLKRPQTSAIYRGMFAFCNSTGFLPLLFTTCIPLSHSVATGAWTEIHTTLFTLVAENILPKQKKNLVRKICKSNKLNVPALDAYTSCMP